VKLLDARDEAAVHLDDKPAVAAEQLTARYVSIQEFQLNADVRISFGDLDGAPYQILENLTDLP
jgi:hypothetical protein